MPTRLLLEGPAIEPLLSQIRQEYGAAARIVSADKIRTGGLGGFFARQRYEVAVEVDDDAPVADPSALGRRRPGYEDRAAATSPTDALLELVEASQDRFRNLPVPHDPPAEPRATARAGLVSTAAPGFAEIMAGLENGVGGFTPVPVADAGLAESFMQAAMTTPSVPAMEAPRTRPVAPVVPAAPRPQAAPVVPLAAVVQTVPLAHPAAPVAPAIPMAPAEATMPVIPAALPHPVVPAPPVAAAPPVAPAPPVASAPRVAPVVPMAAPCAAPASAPPAPVRTVTIPLPPETPVHPYQPGLVATPVPTVGPLTAELTAVGVPAELAAKSMSTDPYKAVLELFNGLAAVPAPPDRPGDVLVIAGELLHALPVANRVAELLRLEPTRVLLAGPSIAGTGMHASRRISGPADALRRSRRMHRDDVPHVVVIDAPLDGASAEWVRDVCDALGATAVWAVVDATRKTTETARQLADIGQVDALAVYGALGCGDPASVLALPAPVALIDGRPAAPEAWADLLVPRLREGGNVAD